MSNTEIITVSGGFHNVNEITIRVKVDPRWGIKLSQGQNKRLGKHMCGVKGCICGMHHGWVVDGVNRGDLSDAIINADVDAYLSSSVNKK